MKKETLRILNEMKRQRGVESNLKKAFKKSMECKWQEKNGKKVPIEWMLDKEELENAEDFLTYAFALVRLDANNFCSKFIVNQKN